jgi:tellurite resistance protein
MCLGATLLLGGWLTGRWIAAPPDQDSIHPGYLLPLVAGGLNGGEAAANFAFPALGWTSFGIGVLCGLLLNSVVLNRLLSRPVLPTALVPTLALEAGLPANAANAYAALTDGRLDAVAYALAGYTVLTVLVQVCLLPLYRAQPFTPGYWAFTFSYAAVAVDALRWIQVERLGWAMFLGYAVLGALTVFIGSIAVRSLVALRQGRFLPVPGASSAAAEE